MFQSASTIILMIPAMMVQPTRFALPEWLISDTGILAEPVIHVRVIQSHA
jgi:hypothetical protein